MKHVQDIAFAVVYQKFSSTEELRTKLLQTGNKVIAEMTSRDHNWGTGVNLGTPKALDPHQWPGKNVLGKALMMARAKLRDGALAEITTKAGGGETATKVMIEDGAEGRKSKKKDRWKKAES